VTPQIISGAQLGLQVHVPAQLQTPVPVLWLAVLWPAALWPVAPPAPVSAWVAAVRGTAPG